MLLTRHATATPEGYRWAVDGRFLPRHLTLKLLLELPRAQAVSLCATLVTDEPASGTLLAPVEPEHEVWASGVTYLRSRQARTAESAVKDVYERVYEAERPELFFKATGSRAVGNEMPIGIRRDSSWHVPEPELTLVVTRQMEVLGYTAGNDVSSRDIEGDNPLYLPQAKVFVGSCALGPGIVLAQSDEVTDLPIACTIERKKECVWSARTRSSQMKRQVTELTSYLGRELDFPFGVLLMTGTGIVPEDSFSLEHGDRVRVSVGTLTLENPVESSR